MRLDGKVAIITGAAAGIEAGTAERFLEEGCRLVLVDWDDAQLQERWGEAGPSVRLYAGEIAEKSTSVNAVAIAIEAFGRLDIVFNNAGIMTYGPFLEQSDQDWDTLLHINLRGRGS